MALSQTSLDLLDAIEALEMRSLAWGYVDGALSETDAIALLGSAGLSAAALEDALEELIEAKAVLETTSAGGGPGLRSRFAEMMRLLVGNRQLFPGKPWQGAPRLVSDFRVDRRKRRFPIRDRAPASVVADLGPEFQGATRKAAIWTALTSRPGFRLAGFQARAVSRILASGDDAGTIVTAGTGSGKTIAFYLPAMIRIAEAVTEDRWVKAIAIYPRIELLKDQFAEAFRMARSTDLALSGLGARSIVLGALYKSTPTMASVSQLERKRWVARADGHVCPWMRCPTCSGDLIWKSQDVADGRERLTCAVRGCDGVIPETQIVLTRRRLQQQPPDILFTTTEILNQRLSDHWMRGLFGIGSAQGRKPFLALLDEVHTYQGASGAQAALTLRRWRHLLGTPITWVGLSATLQDAARFFVDLTGAHPDRVLEITPLLAEIEEKGAEYQILLRGDAASRSSLLSTTIQTSMLLPRLLDPPAAPRASGAFGRRAFLFTDDLDVTNRLFDDLRDAEGLTIFGKVDPQRRPLASMRANGPDAAARDLQGQRWRVCEDLGYALNHPLVVGRTTSQDGGVDPLANVIVATSTLEVGFNDPFVGAVIQHKAPRGMASFLQRKGRAGRDRDMRPIMLTVLSDYGRDRAFYQAYEHLFDPSLEPQHLPVRNPYILRIQAVFALIDWMAARTAGAERAWLWDVLSRPAATQSGPQARILTQCRGLLSKLAENDPATLADLQAYLSAALSIEPTVATTLLWEAPRSILLEVVPTLIRRLARQWRLAFPEADRTLDFQTDYHPLPDFVPRNLFSDLSLPEVEVHIPAATVNHEDRSDGLPIVQALNQLAPGRVTRRFAFERGGLSHWSPVDPAQPEQVISISEYAAEHEFVGLYRSTMNATDDTSEYLVYRPWAVRLERADRRTALPTSNSRLSWRSSFAANGDPLSIPISPRSAWRPLVVRVDFHLHRFRSNVSVARFAPTAAAIVRTLTDDVPVAVSFASDDGRPAALGFEIEVDGFRVELTEDAITQVTRHALSPALEASSKLAYLRDRLRSDTGLPDDLNSFQRDWLFQILVSALMADSAATGRSLTDTGTDVLDEDVFVTTFGSVMTTLFGAATTEQIDQDDADLDDDPDDAVTAQTTRSGRSSRLQEALDLHLDNPVVRERLRALASEITEPDPAAFAAWLRRLILDTLGEAMLQACITAAPRQATLDTLLVDIRDTPGDGASVWISESTLGGAGVLEAFAELFGSDPRIFFAAESSIDNTFEP